jgi:predicted transcriptional regulator
MLSHHKLLQVMYEIVKNDSRPLHYQLQPRDLILHSFRDWSNIQAELELLKSEGLIAIQELNVVLISITAKGMEEARKVSAVEQ